MRIAIIGAGNVGGGFARAAARAGHELTVTATEPEKPEAVASDTGARVADSNAAAVEGAELVLLAVPGTVAPDVAAEIAGVLAPGAVVVDASNPLDETYSDLALQGTSGAEAVQRAAGAVPVVKAFNTVFAGRYADPAEDGRPLQVLLAGDDDAAKARVGELATSLGFDPLDAGGLRFARTMEEMAFLNIALNASRGWAWQSAWQLVGPTG